MDTLKPLPDKEETITLKVSVLSEMLREARRAGAAEHRKASFRAGADSKKPLVLEPHNLSLIDQLLKQGHTPFVVFKALENGRSYKVNLQAMDNAGYFIRRTLFHRPYLANTRRDVFDNAQLADIKTLLELGPFTTETIAERYKKPGSEVKPESYFVNKLKRSGYIIGHLLEKKP